MKWTVINEENLVGDMQGVGCLGGKDRTLLNPVIVKDQRGSAGALRCRVVQIKIQILSLGQGL